MGAARPFNKSKGADTKSLRLRINGVNIRSLLARNTVMGAAVGSEVLAIICRSYGA